MLSLNPPNSFCISHHLRLRSSTPRPPKSSSLFTVSSTIIRPSSSSSSSNLQQQVYQPFRPPPSPLPAKFRSLDTEQQLHILSNRLGLWFEYAPLISSLIRQGFSHSSIEELTGISGVEQNRFVVAAQVRESLVDSQAHPDTLSFFDTSGAELLYQIRLLSAAQRASAASYIVRNRFDTKAAEDLARAIKDFPRRSGDAGWNCFTYSSPGDCLAFLYFRQGREHPKPSEQRTSALERALEVAETEKAKRRVSEELGGEGVDEKEEETVEVAGVKVPVVRMRYGEVAEATSVVVLPVCEAGEGAKAVAEAPGECRSDGAFGVVVAERGWRRWVVLPCWEPVVGLLGRGGVVVAFEDARVLPWKVNRWYKEEALLVVVDRERREVRDDKDDGFYLVAVVKKEGEEDGYMKVERGAKVKELGLEGECLGAVVLVIRPPKDDLDDELCDEDWE